MEGRVGSIDLGSKSEVAHGDHYIKTTCRVKNGLTGLTAGTAMKVEATELVHLAADTDKCVCVLDETIDDGYKNALAVVIIHGPVRREKITFTDKATPLTAALVEGLRAAGIYAI